MNRLQLFHRLQFKNDAPFDNDIGDQMAYMLVTILDVNRLLLLKAYALRIQLYAHGILVHAFEQAGAKLAAHIHRRPDYAARQRIFFRNHS